MRAESTLGSRPGFDSSPPVLTASEVVYFFGDRFVDSQRAQTANRQTLLSGKGKVSTERLVVAMIRAAVLASDAAGTARLVCREGEMRNVLEEINAIGPGGALIGALGQMPFLQTAMARPVPHVQRVAAAALDSPPAGSLEFLLIQPHESDTLSHIVMYGLQRSASNAIRRVNDSLTARGLIEVRARAFGWLAPVCTPTDFTRQPAEARLPAVEAALNASRSQDPQGWDALGKVITIALNAGFSG